MTVLDELFGGSYVGAARPLHAPLSHHQESTFTFENLIQQSKSDLMCDGGRTDAKKETVDLGDYAERSKCEKSSNVVYLRFNSPKERRQ